MTLGLLAKVAPVDREGKQALTLRGDALVVWWTRASMAQIHPRDHLQRTSQLLAPANLQASVPSLLLIEPDLHASIMAVVKVRAPFLDDQGTRSLMRQKVAKV